MSKLKKVVSMVLVFMTVFSVFTILPSEVFHSAVVRAAEMLESATGAEETQPTETVETTEAPTEPSTAEECKHNYVLTSSSAPTCTEKGTDTYTCSICGDTYTDTGKEVLLDKSRYFESEHNYSNYTDKTWTFSEEGAEYLLFTFTDESLLEGCDHVYFYNRKGVLVADANGAIGGKTIKVPGDTFTIRFYTDGSVVYYGFAFKSIYARMEYNAKGHSFTQIGSKEPTCTEKGTKTCRCRTCGYTYTDTGYDIDVDPMLYPASDHNYANSMNKTWSFSQEGADHLDLTFYEDCATENGCDHVYVYDSQGNVVADYTGFFGNAKLTVPGDSFTIRLTTDGSVINYGFSFTDINARYEYNATGHKYELTSSVPPTCTENGKGTYVCSVCGDSYEDNGDDVLLDPSNYIESPHNYSDNMDKTWTFNYPGASHYNLKFSSSCFLENSCDNLYVYDSKGNQLAHYTYNFGGATLTVNDSLFKIRLTTDHSVTFYGFSFESIYINGPFGATGHSFTNYVSESECSCTKAGTATAECDHGCGATDTRENAAIGHSFTNYVSDGNKTCTKNGTKTAVCDNGCGVTNTVVDYATGHTWDEGVKISDSTCTQQGQTRYTCTTCGETRTEYADLAEHNYVETYVPETCTKRAYYSYTCSKCGHSFSLTDSRLLDESEYPESEHNYTNNYDNTWNYSYKDAKQLTLKFKNDCHTETNHDYVYIYDDSGKQIGSYSGAFGGQVCTVNGNSFSVRLSTDSTESYYGFGFESIYADVDLPQAKGHHFTATVTHPDGATKGYTTYTCDDCGYSYVEADPPDAIDKVTITPRETKITLTWQISTEYDTNKYRIYRKAEDETEFKLVGEVNNRNTISFDDNNVAADKIYSYYVVGVDAFGQESLTHDIVSAGLIDDTVPPQFIKMMPASNSFIYGKTTFTITATDNVGITKTELYYSNNMDAPLDSWTLLDEHNGSTYSQSIDTSVMPSAEVFIRAKVYDAVGNYSYSTAYRYMCDNVGPEKVNNVQCIAVGGTTATLSWDNVADNDIYYYIVEQKQSDGSYKNVARTGSSLGVNLSNLTPETDYTYRVIGYDKYNNRGTASDEITVTTPTDTIAPKVTKLNPEPGYYKDSIPLQFTATDDYKIKSIRIEASTDKKEWKTIDELDAETESANYTFNYNLDLADYKDGSLFIRAYVTDSYGNTTDEKDLTCNEYVVDKTAAAVPSGVTASAGETEGDSSFVCVAWDAITNDNSFSYYRVYRSNSEDGEYTLIKDRLKTVNTYDENVEFSATYYYKVESVDLAGNVSERSQAVMCKVNDDTEKPVVYGISPADGSKINLTKNSISVAASDNAKLSNLKIEYKTNSLFSSYTTLKEITGNTKNNCQTTVAIPLDSIDSGTEVTVKVTASDSAGNEADEKTVTYIVDKDAPSVKDIALTKTDDNVFTTKWTTDDADTSYFYVYRKTAANSSFVLYDSVMAETGKTSYSYTDENVAVADRNVKYRITAYDDCGNSSSEDTETLDVTGVIAPIAQLDCPSTVVFGSEYMYNATASTDDSSVVKYSFDFGDGSNVIESTEGKQLHVYTAVGTYTITLVVTDDDGNTDTLTKQIKVTTRELVSKLTAVVKDDSGNILPNTNVYVDLGTENQQCVVTDSKGVAEFEVPVGTHTVSSYKTDYLPVKQDVAVTSSEAYVNLVLVNEPIVTGEFEIHKMTFDEIKAAGIDINAAENRNVVKINVTLVYEAVPIQSVIYWNGTTVKAEPIYVNTSNGTRKLTPTVIGGGSYSGTSGGGGASTTIENPTIVYIDVPVEFSYVKEFFNVSLHIINHASSDFSLLNNTVTLNVPDGLSLVKTNSSEEKATVYIDEIAGQTQKTVNWVLRGDNPGEYAITADYLGMLSYFNEPVSAKFIADDKIEVQDASSIDVNVETSEYSYGGKVFYNVVVQNNGNFALDGFKWEPLTESFYDEYVDAQGNSSEMKEQRDTLQPDEKFVYHYFTETGGLYKYIDNIVDDLDAFGANVNVSVHDAKYFLDKYYEKFPEESGAFVFYVKDSSGNAVSGATVELNAETTVTTDDEGRAIIDEEDRDKIECSYLKVSCNGYYDYLDNHFSGVIFGKKAGVTLYRVGEFVVTQVLADGQDAISSKVSINTNDTDSSDNPSKITFISQIYGDDITSVDLVQDGKVVSSSGKDANLPEHMFINNYSVNSFAEGKPVELQVTRSAHKTEKIKLNINSINVKFDTDLKMPDKAKITIMGTSVDFLNGASFEFSFTDKLGLSYQYDRKENTVTVGVNFDIEKELGGSSKPDAGSDDKKEDTNDKDEDDSFWGQKGNTTFDDVIKKCQEEYNKAKGKRQTDKGSSFDFSVQGALEFKVKDDGSLEFSKSKLYLGVSVGFEYSTDFVVYAIPLTMTVGVTLSAGAEATVVYNDTRHSFGLDSLELKLSAGLEVSAGVGVSCLSAGLYGSVELAFDINLLEAVEVKKIELSGELGLYVKLLFYSDKYPLVSGALTVYEKEYPDNAVYSLRKAMAAVYEADSYSVNNDLMSYNSAWSNAVTASDGTTTLLENAYSGSKPQLAVCGDKVVMVYQSIDSSADCAANALALYYSVYDTNTGKWSASAKLDNNKNADMAYSLAVDGDNVYVVYSQSNSQNSEDVAMEDAVKNIDIYSAVFNADTNSFNAPLRITQNETYDTNPVVKNIGGVMTAVWANSSSNNPFFNDNSNSLMTSQFINGSWTQPQAVAQNISSVVNYDVVDVSNNGCVVYSTDADGDLSTSDDRTIQIYNSATGATKTLAQNVETSVTTGEVLNNSVVMWYENGSLMQYNISTDEVTTVCDASSALADGFELVSDNNGNYSIVYIQDKQSVCALYLNTMTGKWSSPVTLATSDNYIENLDAEYVNGKLTLTYYDATVVDDEMNVESKLVTTVADTNAKPVITYADVDFDTLNNNEDGNINVTVSNNSSEPTGNLTFNVYNYDGTSIGNFTTENTSLSAGESGEFTVPFTVPAQIVNRDITVTVTDSTGRYVSSYKLNLARTDMTVKAQQYIDGDTSYIKAVVSNNYSYSSTATLEVYNRFTNDVYYTTNISNVVKGSPVTATIPLDKSYVDQNGFVSVRVISKATDNCEYNNTDMFEIYKEKASASSILLGDTDGDGRISILDVTIIQLYLAGRTTLTDDNLTAADVNRDGAVDVADATMIRYYTAQYFDRAGYCGQWLDNSTGVATPTPDGYAKLGDVDFDCFVTQGDLSAIQSYMIGETAFGTAQIAAADVNRDGRIDVADITLIEQYMADKINGENQCGTYVEIPDKYILTGDVNLDGCVSIEDAQMIQLYVITNEQLSDDQLIAADVNHDGMVDVVDSTLIGCYLAGKTLGDNYCGLLTACKNK